MDDNKTTDIEIKFQKSGLLGYFKILHILLVKKNFLKSNSKLVKIVNRLKFDR